MNRQAFEIILEQNRAKIIQWLNQIQQPGGQSFQNETVLASYQSRAVDSDSPWYAVEATSRCDAPFTILAFITECDPTPKSIYTRWMLKRFLAGDFGGLIEDVTKATESLDRFDRAKSTFPQQHRDINFFKNFSALNAYVAYVEVKPSKKSIKAGLKEALLAKGEAEHFFENDDIRIVIPRTKEAAIYFGKNTKWCTAASGFNMFEVYHRQGPLYVILFKKENVRWQLHFESDQFMDEADKPITPAAAWERGMEKLFPFKAQARKRPRWIQFVKNPSKTLRMQCLKKNGHCIEWLKDLTKEEYDLALKTSPQIIQTRGYPATPARWKKAVLAAPWLIESHPKPPIDLIKQVIPMFPAALRMVPIDERGRDLCMDAVINTPRPASSREWECIPFHGMDMPIYASSQNDVAKIEPIYNVPIEIIDEEMIREHLFHRSELNVGRFVLAQFATYHVRVKNISDNWIPSDEESVRKITDAWIKGDIERLTTRLMVIVRDMMGKNAYQETSVFVNGKYVRGFDFYQHVKNQVRDVDTKLNTIARRSRHSYIGGYYDYDRAPLRGRITAY